MTLERAFKELWQSRQLGRLLARPKPARRRAPFVLEAPERKTQVAIVESDDDVVRLVRCSLRIG